MSAALSLQQRAFLERLTTLGRLSLSVLENRASQNLAFVGRLRRRGLIRLEARCFVHITDAGREILKEQA